MLIKILIDINFIDTLPEEEFINGMAEIIKIGIEYFKIFSFAIPFVTLTMICSRIMQGLGKAYPMLIITSLRVIVISCSLAYIFIEYLNKPLHFAWYAILISCIFSSLVASIWMITIKKNIVLD